MLNKYFMALKKRTVGNSSFLLLAGMLCIAALLIAVLVFALNGGGLLATKNSLAQAVSVIVPSRPPQFVVLSFDGSRSLPMWQETRDFSKQMAARGIKVKFTYFISSVYLLADQYKDKYVSPGKPAGSSLIGFATDTSDVIARAEQIEGAMAEGHEIASHMNGHFDGNHWSLSEWEQEFSSFDNLVHHWKENNGLADDPVAKKINIATTTPGFRAPSLAINGNMWPALKKFGYRYDTSTFGDTGEWPKKNNLGLWVFPIPEYFLMAERKEVLGIDYNVYLAQSYGKEWAKKGDENWDRFSGEMLDAELRYFYKSYDGNRAPVFVMNHFSDWNDGAYWATMKSFAEKVCGKPNVQCVTYGELADYLDETKR